MTGPTTGAAPFREAEIDVGQLGHNIARFRGLNEGKPLFADVGANAWGHGLAVIVPAMAELGVNAFVVARIAEAELIREVDSSTLIVTTQHAADDTFDRAAALNVAPAIRTRLEFDRSVSARVPAVVLVGDDGAGLPALAQDELRSLAVEAREHGVGVILIGDVALAGPELFGVSTNDAAGGASGYRPVMRLWAPVAATKRVGSDEGVSYGYTYRTASESTLALVTLGYADGVSRSGGNRLAARLRDTTHTVAGRVAMDAFMVDLGDVPAPALGTEATVLGDAERGEPTAREQGRRLGMQSAEVVTRLTARPHRYPVGEIR